MSSPFNPLKQMLALLLVGSFLVGGIAGGVAGVLVTQASENRVSSWIQKAAGRLDIDQSTLDQGNADQALSLLEDSVVVDVVDQLTPSAVSIVVTAEVQNIYGSGNYFFGNPFEFPEGGSQRQEVGGGTGFIIQEDGLILTNRHVVSREDADYTVVMNDGKKYDAKVLSRDTVNDIAILKIEAKGLPAVALGDSDRLKIGQTVIAIGNVLGQYSNSVTRGVLSGVNRTVTVGEGTDRQTLEGVLQTDAAINFGNSGGPLVNLAGQVVGINTAVDRGGESIAFAIPINQAKSAVESVKTFGRIVRPVLGIRYIEIDEVLAKQNQLPYNEGVLVARGSTPAELAVIPGSAADLVGIEENDIILEINGQKLDAENSLTKEIQKYQPGDEIRLKIWHDGEEREEAVTLQERKE
ncbi:MAG: trypsin-like peptidase domain-containing protein [Patescibacteria group bacterium]